MNKEIKLRDVMLGILALFSFQPYTNMSRILEVLYGIAAWLNVAIIIWAINK